MAANPNDLAYFDGGEAAAVAGQNTDLAYFDGGEAFSYAAATGTNATVTPATVVAVASVKPVYFRRYERAIRETTGLVHYWKLDEGAGTTATDDVGGTNGTYTNTPTLHSPTGFTQPATDLTTDYAVEFTSASSEWVSIGDATVFENTNFSVELWFKSKGADHYGLFGEGQTADSSLWFIRTLPEGNVGVRMNDTNGALTLDEWGDWNDAHDGGWHHVVVVVAGTQMTMYNDGVVDTYFENIAFTKEAVTMNQVGLGLRATFGTGDTFLNGYLNDVSSYNVALSAGTVLAHYRAATAVDATVNPSTVVATAAVPSPTVKTSATVAAATVAAVATVPAPTLSIGTTTTPATVVAVGAVGAPTISLGTTVTPSTVVSVAAVNSPTVSLSATATPSTVVSIAAVNGPTLSIGTTVTPSTVAAIAAIPAPSVVAVTTISPAAVTGVAAIPTVDAVGAMTLDNMGTDLDTMVWTLDGEPFDAGDETVVPPTVVCVASIPAPTISTSVTVTPTTVVCVATVPAPSISTSATVTPATVQCVATIPDPTVVTAVDTTVTPATVDCVATVPDPTIITGTDATVTPDAVAAMADVPAPTVSGGATVEPATVGAIGDVPSPTISDSVTITPTTVTAIADVPAPTISVGATVTPTPVDATSTVPPIQLLLSTTVEPSPVNAVAAMPVTTVFVRPLPCSPLEARLVTDGRATLVLVHNGSTRADISIGVTRALLTYDGITSAVVDNDGVTRADVEDSLVLAGMRCH